MCATNSMRWWQLFTNSMRWWQLLLFAQFAHAPSSGPGTGGTSVVLHSTEAVAACQFGTFNVTASPLTSTTYSCTTPSSLRAGAAAAPRPEDVFAAAILQGSAWRGGDGVVHLTTTRSYEVTGTLLVPSPLAGAASAEVSVDFELFVGRGVLGGAGFSVSLAPLGHTVVLADEHGLADGIAVAFLPLENRVVVTFDHKVVASVNLDGRSREVCDHYNCGNCAARADCLRASARCGWHEAARYCFATADSLPELHVWRSSTDARWVKVAVSVVDERLTVVHNGHTYVRALPLPGWAALAAAPLTPAHPEIYRAGAAAAPWYVALGARTTLDTEDYYVRDVRIRQGGLVGEAKVAVEARDASGGAVAGATEVRARARGGSRGRAGGAAPRTHAPTHTSHIPHHHD